MTRKPTQTNETRVSVVARESPEAQRHPAANNLGSCVHYGHRPGITAELIES